MASGVRPRVLLGRDLQIVAQRADAIELEGAIRLRPGREVDLILRTAEAVVIRRAVVWQWAVATVGSGGPVFRGVCGWV